MADTETDGPRLCENCGEVTKLDRESALTSALTYAVPCGMESDKGPGITDAMGVLVFRLVQPSTPNAEQRTIILCDHCTRQAAEAVARTMLTDLQKLVLKRAFGPVGQSSPIVTH